MYFSFLFAFVLITSQVEAKNSCNDECLTKTYCISSDGSSVCSKNNLVTAQFEVIPVFGTFDYLRITLKAYNVRPDDEKTVKLSIDKLGSLKNVNTCYKSSNGSTNARFDRGAYGLATGSSDYTEGVLNCSWSFNIDSPIWPMGMDLLKDSSQSITLYDDSKEALVAINTTQLPMYHAQYLKCCNKVHGNDAFMITFDQTEKQILYRLYYWQFNAKEVAVDLKRNDGTQLRFECLKYPYVEGYIINGTVQMSIDQQIIDPYGLNAEMCSWVTPLVLGDSTINIDASRSVFDLKVQVDSFTIYTENNVTLKN